MLATSLTTRFRISQSAFQILLLDPSEEDLGMLFETNQFSPELEEYLFEKMDNCPADKSYLQLVQEELSKLDLSLLPTSVEVVGY